MRDYTRLVSRTPPEGLWKWAVDTGRRSTDDGGSLDTYGLVYEKVYIPDTTVDGLIGGRQGKKIPVARCSCSACGSVWDADYMPAEAPDGATYGFLTEENGEPAVAVSGDCTLCSRCGSPVRVKCKSKVRRDTYAGCEAYVCSESWHMSAALLPGEPGQRPLVLTGWCLRRYCSREGRDRKVALPCEAYVFDARSCTKLTGRRRAYGGSAGYYTAYARSWSQPKTWQETWGADGSIYGLTEELLAAKAGCSKETILNAEKGKRSTNIGVCVKIAAALDTTVGRLLDEGVYSEVEELRTKNKRLGLALARADHALPGVGRGDRHGTADDD